MTFIPVQLHLFQRLIQILMRLEPPMLIILSIPAEHPHKPPDESLDHPVRSRLQLHFAIQHRHHTGCNVV